MSRERTPEFEAWVQRARDADILEEALARGAQLKRFGHEWVGPCPACGGVDRFAINPAKGLFNCRGAVGGDAIKMIEHIEGLGFLQAVREITGEGPPGSNRRRGKRTDPELRARIQRQQEHAAAERERRRKEHEANERENQKRAGQIWYAAKPIDGTPAEAYLLNRGIPRPPEGWPDVFRFNPSVNYPQHGKHPALICRVDNPRGVPNAIWRIYITNEGRKADLVKTKRGLGPAAGCAVRIGGIGPHLGIAEGVESALGAWFLTGRKFPVWAALSTSGLVGFNVPERVERLTIFPDGDRGIRKRGDQFEPSEPPGRAAARKLQERLHSQSIPCVIAAEPAAGLDYCDLWVDAQKESAA